MIKLFDFEKEIKKNILHNCYVFCSVDSKLINDSIKNIKDKILSDEFIDLNYVQIDGRKVEDVGSIVNACETMPFMSDKKVVEVYNADFLKDGKNAKLFNDIKSYVKDIPNHCVLIMYYLFENDREKPSRNLNKFSKNICVVKLDKLKGFSLENKVKELFETRKVKISKSDLKLFCSQVDNNMDIVEREIDKLCSYTYGRAITKDDIFDVMPQKSENDIFNLVDFLSQRKINKALDIFNELVYRGEAIPKILYMVERQFKLLLNVKLGINEGKNKDVLSRELSLHPFVCENMMKQSKKFKKDQIMNILELCIKSDKKLKSSSIDAKTEIELLIMSTIIA
ncbi:DNA polymerase III subunit delta [Haloimpatiens sp. FM7330]|uniref:DNA polymerase III subunit delta n=1 Tax=Haloimpatiens sp. FM7330 TaxID=3298610 RepID=UPI003632CB7B